MLLLLSVRWALKTGQFAAPIAAGLAVIWVVLWFAAWWPPVFGLEGAAYFLAAFFTSWTLVPILWVSEFARIVRLIDGYAEATLVLLDRRIAHRRWGTKNCVMAGPGPGHPRVQPAAKRGSPGQAHYCPV